jgi:nitronate monooxygenase
VPVVAAGGLADGRGLAAALALGACGAWMGTRFVASAESGNAPGYKQRIAQAGFADLVETTLFDGGWPSSPHRVVRNSTVARWEAGGRPASGSRPGEGERIGSFPDGTPMLRYNVSAPWASMEGDWEAGPHYAGASAALVRERGSRSPPSWRGSRPRRKPRCGERCPGEPDACPGGRRCTAWSSS